MRGGIPTAILLLSCLVGCRSFALRPNAQWDAAAEMETQVTMARYNERDGNYPRAKELYQEILARDPGNATAHHRLGVISVRQGLLEEGAAHLQQARALKPGNPEVMTDLGYTLYLQNRYSEAGTALQEALVADPANKRAMNNMALVMGKQGQMGEAHSLFRQVGNDAQANANLAFLYAQAGKLQEAEDLYSRALDDDSELTVAAEALLELVQRRDSSRVAAATESRSKNAAPDAKRQLKGLVSVDDDEVSNANEGSLSREEMTQFVSYMREMIDTKRAAAEAAKSAEPEPSDPPQSQSGRRVHSHFNTLSEIDSGSGQSSQDQSFNTMSQ